MIEEVQNHCCTPPSAAAAAFVSLAIALQVKTPPETEPNVADGGSVDSSVPVGEAVADAGAVAVVEVDGTEPNALFTEDAVVDADPATDPVLVADATGDADAHTASAVLLQTLASVPSPNAVQFVHAVQPAAPAPLYRPGAHVVHAWAPVATLLYAPAAHAVHTNEVGTVSIVLNLPAVHAVHTKDEAAAATSPYLPLPHTEQAENAAALPLHTKTRTALLAKSPM